MVRKTVVMGLMVVLVLVLVACGGSQADTSPVVSGDQAPAGMQFDVGEMPLSSLLPVGTLMLEETEYAVTPEQAQELLPMWQMLRALQESGTAAEVETDAVLKQIQEAMTAEQLAAIEEMDQEDMAELMQDIGMRRQSQDTDDDDDRGGFPMGGGGMPMGDMGGMPGGPMGSGEEAEGTPAAGGMGGFGTAFIEQVIELLETRAAEA